MVSFGPFHCTHFIPIHVVVVIPFPNTLLLIFQLHFIISSLSIVFKSFGNFHCSSFHPNTLSCSHSFYKFYFSFIQLHFVISYLLWTEFVHFLFWIQDFISLKEIFHLMRGDEYLRIKWGLTWQGLVHLPAFPIPGQELVPLQWKTILSPQCLEVSSQVVSGDPRAARNSGIDSFGLGEVLPCSWL